MTGSLDKYNPQRRSGDEELPSGVLRDFWRWIGSDLVGNTTRGLFAEYLVGLAVGALTGKDADSVRDEWAAHDLVTPNGITIEVKSSAYLQTWRQEKEATPRFGIARTEAWNSATGKSSEEKGRWSDVYVFCLLHHRNKATLDPRDVNQWTFFVLFSPLPLWKRSSETRRGSGWAGCGNSGRRRCASTRLPTPSACLRPLPQDERCAQRPFDINDSPEIAVKLGCFTVTRLGFRGG